MTTSYTANVRRRVRYASARTNSGKFRRAHTQVRRHPRRADGVEGHIALAPTLACATDLRVEAGFQGGLEPGDQRVGAVYLLRRGRREGRQGVDDSSLLQPLLRLLRRFGRLGLCCGGSITQPLHLTPAASCSAALAQPLPSSPQAKKKKVEATQNAGSAITMAAGRACDICAHASVSARACSGRKRWPAVDLLVFRAALCAPSKQDA